MKERKMTPSDEHIKKAVGRPKEQSPLKKLEKINNALKKLGCQTATESSKFTYRKIVGRK
jgi:hypothetical protein